MEGLCFFVSSSCCSRAYFLRSFFDVRFAESICSGEVPDLDMYFLFCVINFLFIQSLTLGALINQISFLSHTRWSPRLDIVINVYFLFYNINYLFIQPSAGFCFPCLRHSFFKRSNGSLIKTGLICEISHAIVVYFLFHIINFRENICYQVIVFSFHFNNMNHFMMLF